MKHMNNRTSSTIQTEICGLPAEVTKKPRQKHMYVRISSEGILRISAPKATSDREIASFVGDNLGKIIMQRNRALEAADKRNKFLSGEIVYIWGEPQVLQVLHEEGKVYFMQRQGQLVINVPADSGPDQREQLYDEYLRKLLRRRLPEVTDRCEKITGLRALEYRIKNMKTRWGTCNVKAKRIWINLQLAKYSPQCLEAIVLHELTHLLESGHSKKFYKHLLEFCPEYKSIVKELKNL